MRLRIFAHKSVHTARHSRFKRNKEKRFNLSFIHKFLISFHSKFSFLLQEKDYNFSKIT